MANTSRIGSPPSLQHSPPTIGSWGLEEVSSIHDDARFRFRAAPFPPRDRAVVSENFRGLEPPLPPWDEDRLGGVVVCAVLKSLDCASLHRRQAEVLETVKLGRSAQDEATKLMGRRMQLLEEASTRQSRALECVLERSLNTEALRSDHAVLRADLLEIRGQLGEVLRQLDHSDVREYSRGPDVDGIACAVEERLSRAKLRMDHSEMLHTLQPELSALKAEILEVRSQLAKVCTKVDQSELLRAVREISCCPDLQQITRAIEEKLSGTRLKIDSGEIREAVQGLSCGPDVHAIASVVEEKLSGTRVRMDEVLQATRRIEASKGPVVIDFSPILVAINKIGMKVDQSEVLQAIHKVQTGLDVREIAQLIGDKLSHSTLNFQTDLAPVMAAIESATEDLSPVLNAMDKMHAEVLDAISEMKVATLGRRVTPVMSVSMARPMSPNQTCLPLLTLTASQGSAPREYLQPVFTAWYSIAGQPLRQRSRQMHSVPGNVRPQFLERSESPASRSHLALGLPSTPEGPRLSPRQASQGGNLQSPRHLQPDSAANRPPLPRATSFVKYNLCK